MKLGCSVAHDGKFWVLLREETIDAAKNQWIQKKIMGVKH